MLLLTWMLATLAMSVTSLVLRDQNNVFFNSWTKKG